MPTLSDRGEDPRPVAPGPSPASTASEGEVVVVKLAVDRALRAISANADDFCDFPLGQRQAGVQDSLVVLLLLGRHTARIGSSPPGRPHGRVHFCRHLRYNGVSGRRVLMGFDVSVDER